MKNQENSDRIPVKKFVVGIVLSPVILGVFWIIMVLLLSLGKASGAVVITELTVSEKNEFVANSENLIAAWTQVQAGNRSSAGGDSDNETEVFINNTTAPILKDQHDWIPGVMANSIDDSFIISHDDSVARVYVTAGNGNTVNLPLTKGFNTLLITIGDSFTIGATTFSGSVAGESFNWSVDNGLKYYRVDLGEDSPSLDIDITEFVAGSGADIGNVRFRTEFYSTPVPEPSVAILGFLGFTLLFRRNR